MFQEQAKMVESWKKILWITLKKWNQHQLQVSTPSQCHQDWTMWIGSPAIQHSIIILPFSINVKLTLLVAFRWSFIYSRQFFMNKIQNFIQNSNVWKSQHQEFQCLEKPKSRIPMFGNCQKLFRVPMFGKAKIKNSKLEKPKFGILFYVWKSQNWESQCLEKPKFRILMIGKAKIQNSNVWKSWNSEFQCSERQKSRILLLVRFAKLHIFTFAREV